MPGPTSLLRPPRCRKRELLRFPSCLRCEDWAGQGQKSVGSSKPLFVLPPFTTQCHLEQHSLFQMPEFHTKLSWLETRLPFAILSELGQLAQGQGFPCPPRPHPSSCPVMPRSDRRAFCCAPSSSQPGSAEQGPLTVHVVWVNHGAFRLQWCPQCCFHRPPRTYHCPWCNICVEVRAPLPVHQPSPHIWLGSGASLIQGLGLGVKLSFRTAKGQG